MDAGKGLFVTAELKRNTLIGVYTGRVGTQIDTDHDSNSLFDLGWGKRDGKAFTLVVDGNYNNDGSRYVNAADKTKINMQAFIGIHKEEVTIIYITSKKIAIGM
jgi:hypothetical protein